MSWKCLLYIFPSAKHCFPIILNTDPRSPMSSRSVETWLASIFYLQNVITFKSFWRCCIVCLRHHSMFFFKFIKSFFIYVIFLMRIWEMKKCKWQISFILSWNCIDYFKIRIQDSRETCLAKLTHQVFEDFLLCR